MAIGSLAAFLAMGGIVFAGTALADGGWGWRGHGHGPGDGPGPGIGYMLSKLDLTDAQKQAIAGILQARRTELVAAAERAQQSRAAMMGAMTGAPLDPAAIDAMTEAHKAMLTAWDAVRQEVFAQLTDAQKAKLGERVAKMQQWREQHRRTPGAGIDRLIESLTK
ncbi:MAG: periplasmic heavy metal sensor [Candidatus Lambdaproteobacteria bacterium]|nr:periplasmic heavy metal sensor [Candidatus Lambdaproteobacteria bacterium]